MPSLFLEKQWHL